MFFYKSIFVSEGLNDDDDDDDGVEDDAGIPDICHFFLHRQNLWRMKFTLKNANFSR